MTKSANRQIHLDFHTSEKIPDIAAEFDAKAFAETFKAAYVQSVTVFARCHHGWLYYPSRKFPERIHPNLKNRNLLLEQIDALHGAGIKAPVYITVQYDYLTARTKPEWLVRRPDGSHHGGRFDEPGFYQALCVNTGYFDFLKDMTLEIVRMLGDKLDGLFFDIVGTRACSCAVCRKEMAEKGIDSTDPVAVEAFGKEVIDRFRNTMSEIVRREKKDITVFYNAGHIGPYIHPSRNAFSHFELESLPSGWWGYLHFPATARFARTLGKPCIGMTGKFHTEWGDFHSLKNRAALEYECFKMLGYGFGVSVGDQLEPCGKLNPATYALIGDVFAQLKEREEWAIPSVPVTEAALVTPEGDNPDVPACVYGASQLLEEIAVQFDIIDTTQDVQKYPLLILPEGLHIDGEYAARLQAYVRDGGKVLAVADGGMCDGAYPEFFGVTAEGISEGNDFIVANDVLGKDLAQGNEFVIDAGAIRIRPEKGAKVLQWATMPYFYRNGGAFCSHLYTPSAKADKRPAAVYSGNVLVLSPKLFTQYRKKAPSWCKAVIRDAINVLTEQTQLIRHNGPSTLQCSLLDQPDKHRMALHLLHYVPVRKCTDIDCIEERSLTRDLAVKVTSPHKIVSARIVPDGTELAISPNGEFTVPEVYGYTIVELRYR